MRYGSLQLLGKLGIELHTCLHLVQNFSLLPLGFLQLLLYKVRIDNP